MQHDPLTDQKNTKRIKARSRKDIKILLVLSAIAGIALIGVACFLLLSKSKKGPVQDAAKQHLAETFQTAIEQPDPVTVLSTLGVQATYDTKTVQAKAQTTDASSTDIVTGKEYEGDELKTARDYSILRFIVKKNELEPDFIGFDGSVLTVITNIRTNYFANRISKPEYKGKSKVDIMVTEATERLKSEGYTIGDVTDFTLNSYTFKHFIATTKIGEGNLSYDSQIEHYYTEQNDRPYFITLTTSSPTALQEKTQLEAIIKTLRFTSPDADALSLRNRSPQVAGESTTTPNTITSLPSNSANIPEKLNADTIVDVILRNQPAVVRVGTSGCADITIKDPSSEKTALLPNSCNAAIGSGSFINSDGYVATNGHVVTMTKENLFTGYFTMAKDKTDFLDRFDKVLTFLVDTSLITSTQKDKLTNNLLSGIIEPDALVKAIYEEIKDSITVSNNSSTFILQTSNEPIKYSIENNTFKYIFTKTNIEATLVDVNFGDIEGEKVDLLNITSTDVAILKAKSGKFPAVKSSDFSSITEGDLLTAIGYPAFVDNGLETKKSKTVPSITQGYVDRLRFDPTDTYQLAFTSIPISGGNSGGPSFNKKGEQIGLNTYASLYCPDGKCFGNGTVRNMKDLAELASKNSVVLSANSSMNDAWNDAIDTYLQANYKGAAQKFSAVAKNYPANYLAAEYSKLALDRVGSSEDKSSEYSSHKNVYLLVGLGVVVVALGSAIIIITRKHHAVHPKKVAVATTTPAVDTKTEATKTQPNIGVAATQAPQSATTSTTTTADSSATKETPTTSATPQQAQDSVTSTQQKDTPNPSSTPQE